jgi:hypothetical protein
MKQTLILALLLALSTIANAQWTQIGSDIDGEAADDYSGYSVALSSDGTVVAIGARYNDDNGLAAGHVRVYKNIAGTWTQIGSDIDGEAAGDYLGISVSISSDGSVVATGATFNSGNGFFAGHVRIYENIAGTWTQIGSDIDGEVAYDYSGSSVSLSDDGSVVVIGATHNDGNGTDAGHVRIYENIAGSWTQVGNDIDGEAASDYSGRFVSLSADGSIVAIGASGNDGNGSNAGHVRIYENIAGTWTQIGQDIDGEAADDNSGSSVSLSSDGSIVAIGALFNNGNGTDAGHVRVYENIAGTWKNIGSDIDGETVNDKSGSSVSLSADGSVVAIGARLNDGNGSNAGHVRIYKNCMSSFTISPSACNTYTSPSGKIWTSTASYLDTIPNTAGCDSVITINLTVNYSNTGDTTAIVCDSMAWYGTTYYTSAMPTHSFINVAGCDSVVTLDLTISNNTGDTIAIMCDSMAWYGTTYYTSAMPTHSFINVAGCDSVVTLDLTVNHSNTGDTTAVVCDSLAWYGTTYYTSAFPTHSFMNITGCDSVVTLDLTVNSANTGIDTQTACDSLVWIDGNTYYANNNLATHTLTNAAGCDSVVTLDLTVNYSNTGIDTKTACDSLTWIDGNTYYASNNAATHTLTNAVGCDSVVTLDLTVNYSKTGIDTKTACDSLVWIDGNTYYANNNTATHILTNVAGCDSLVTLDLTVNDANTGIDVQTACFSYLWIDGNTYTSNNNTATHTLSNAAGCDSVVTLDLTINTVDVSVTVNSITLTATLSGASYQWVDCANSYAIIAGETNQSFTPTINGDYAVIIDDGTCVDTSLCYLVTGVEINDDEISSAIVIYPNPSNGNFMLEMNNTKENNIQIEIHDIAVKLIYATAVNDKIIKQQLNMEKEANGLYFLTLTSDQHTETYKLVKN